MEENNGVSTASLDEISKLTPTSTTDKQNGEICKLLDETSELSTTATTPFEENNSDMSKLDDKMSQITANITNSSSTTTTCINEENTDVKKIEKVSPIEKSSSELHIILPVEAEMKLRTDMVSLVEEFDGIGYEKCTRDRTIVQIFKIASEFFKIYQIPSDIWIMEKFCKYLQWNSMQDDKDLSYMYVGLLKETAQSWVVHLRLLVNLMFRTVVSLKPELQTDSRVMSVLLMSILELTESVHWKIVGSYPQLHSTVTPITLSTFTGLVKSRDFFISYHTLLLSGFTRPTSIGFNYSNFSALVNLSNRTLTQTNKLENERLKYYIIYVLTIPGYTYYSSTHSSVTIAMPIFKYVVDFLSIDENLDDCLRELEICDKVSLLANLAQMGKDRHLELSVLIHPKLIRVMFGIVESLKTDSSSSDKRGYWHAILGWISSPIPSYHTNAITISKSQLQHLWGPTFLQACFSPLFKGSFEKTSPPLSPSKSPYEFNLPPTSTLKDKSSWKLGRFLRRVILHRNEEGGGGGGGGKGGGGVSEKESYVIGGEIATFYNSLINVFPSSRVEILSGISFENNSSVLVKLWEFVARICVDEGVEFWEKVLLSPPPPLPSSQLLLLFIQSLTHFITLLDDRELYDDARIFPVSKFCSFAQFLNNLCFRCLVSPDYGSINTSTFGALKQLLLVLYRRDCRRPFCPPGHWLIHAPQTKSCIADLERANNSPLATLILSQMPHIIREESRVIFFRKWVNSERGISSVSLNGPPGSPPPPTVISVNRKRIVEDGFGQLAQLSPKYLKGTIRVRFQNEHGLDEAGIDQDGVFKEFLEETISRVFSPSLNLFKATDDNLLYPSPLSYLHDNHLGLFEFVGKMLGKAMFEGIVVDVRFAPFFLSQMLSFHNKESGLFFCTIDEVQSLDRELYNSLLFVKHYNGDVKDLGLTFSEDKDVLGVIKNVEFFPGGRSVFVTNENKISYIYMKAHFHLIVEIREQANAFIRGFKSIISPEWLKIFSTPEFQRLISGEDSDIDLVDLRRHTQYYGGFHDNHRVIVWLWDILAHDFTEKERKLFLKFVTSCSKPPLLGFANLDPVFSVRCVEVSEEDDIGDSVGSVLRGFFAFGKNEPVGMRLPTSSTCFNLLKLPNYSKRKTLRDKLKYAITSNVGFELS